MNIKNAVKQWLTEKENKRYAKQLQEKQISYHAWIREREEARDALAGDDWESIARMTAGRNSVAGPDDDFVIFLASEGTFLYGESKNIASYFKEHPWVEILYGDEEVCELGQADEPERKSPWFKPDWSPDVFRDHFYFGSAVAVRRSMLDKMEEKGMPFSDFSERNEVSSFIKKFAKDWAEFPLYRVTDEEAYRRWMWECVNFAGGFRAGSNRIGHVSDVWFSCETEAEQRKFLEEPWAGKGECETICNVSVEGNPAGICEDATVPSADETVKSVSVIIPSKDNPEILEQCIRSCYNVTNVSEKDGYEQDYGGTKSERLQRSFPEFIIVDNGSNEENRVKIENFIREQKHLRIIYLYEPMEFNFSRMCNLGASKATGEFLLFLNDDVELCQEGTLEEMMTLAAREYTGAVGLKLLYPGTDKIQHAGITNLPMGPVHKLQFLSDSECYYFNANRGNRNVIAVTAACLMVAKSKFCETGGFSEELRVAFNDVDSCFALYELGYTNVCVNDKYAFHHESLSRGADESEEKLNRLLIERDKLYERHPQLVGIDPYYSEHLNRAGLDTRIRPGYMTSRNQTQKVSEELEKINPSSYRQDECLMVRVEDFSNGTAIGYGVILGDNNACYEKMLLLRSALDIVYGLPLEGQYRPDLEENMPDQINVALSGYAVRLHTGPENNVLPAGNYRVGMAARNRVTGLKLINWTNRFVELG